MAKCLELKAERDEAIRKAEEINKRSEAERRELSGEEQAEFRQLVEMAEKLTPEIAAAERGEMLADVRAEVRSTRARIRVADADPATDRKAALRSWFLAGSDQADLSAEAHYRAAQVGVSLNARSINLRTLTVASGAAPLVTPTFSNILTDTLRARSPLLSLVRTDVTSDGNPRLYALADDTANMAEIVGEGQLISDADPAFSNISVPTYKYSSKMVKVSIEALQDSMVDLEAYIAGAIASRIAVTLEKHVTVGTGTGQPLGLVPALTALTGATTPIAGPVYADLLKLKYSLGQPYWERGTFVISADAFAKIQGMVDGQGRPLWQPQATGGIGGTAGGTILGRPFVVSPWMESYGANKKPLIYADLSNYVLRVAMDVQISRLDERYAEYGLVAWVGLARFGGAWIGSPLAGKYLQCAAS